MCWNRPLGFLFLSLVGLQGALCLPASPDQPLQDQTRLILLIVVDQMRNHYLERFESQFDSGLKLLLDTRRVPFLLRLPEGNWSRVAQQVRTIEIAPTVADLVGVARPQVVDGHSLREWIPSLPKTERP